MQGLRPLALRRIVLLRSKLRQVDATKCQPSFLRLASQQEKHRSFLAKKPGQVKKSVDNFIGTLIPQLNILNIFISS